MSFILKDLIVVAFFDVIQLMMIIRHSLSEPLKITRKDRIK